MELPARYSRLSKEEKAEARKIYEEIQEGNCWFCNESLRQEPPISIRKKPINWDLFPKGFLKHKVHLQHNHTTDKTEGVVHAYCNAVLWQYYRK